MWRGQTQRISPRPHRRRPVEAPELGCNFIEGGGKGGGVRSPWGREAEGGMGGPGGVAAEAAQGRGLGQGVILPSTLAVPVNK